MVLWNTYVTEPCHQYLSLTKIFSWCRKDRSCVGLNPTDLFLLIQEFLALLSWTI
jgi:hypothetical protein